MDALRVLVLFLVYFISDARCYIETVDFFSMCGNGYGWDRSVPDTKRFSVTMNGDNWREESTLCTVIFRSNQVDTDLSITFNSFQLNDDEVELEIHTASSYRFLRLAEYSHYHTPTLRSPIKAHRYLKVTVTRSHSLNVISATFDINTDEYHNRITPSTTKKYHYVSNGFGSGWHFSVGRIIGIVVGVMTAIAMVTIVVRCRMAKARSRAHRSVVVATGNQHATITTTSTIPPGVYPHQAPPEHFAMHPSYTSAPPPRYPGHPGPYPIDYSAPPPSYSSVVNGNTNPMFPRKVEPSAPY